MSDQHDDLLARELAKIGGIGGAIGGTFGGSPAGGAGGAAGAHFANRFLPTEGYQKQVDVSQAVTKVLAELVSFLKKEGRTSSVCEVDESEHPKVSAVLGSGFFNMNPTLVDVEVLDGDDYACTLLVSGAAKEGLIKQRSAQKDVNRVVEFLEMV
jgi:hypothetical protein